MLRCVDYKSGTSINGFWLVWEDQTVFIYRLGIANTSEDLSVGIFRDLEVSEVVDALIHWGHLREGKLSIQDVRRK